MPVTSVNLLEMTPVMPVVQISNAEDAVPLAHALRQGGIAVLEVVLRTPASLEAIRRIRTEVSDVIVGAGTVTDISKLQAAVDAGSEFIITPGLTPTLADAGQSLDIPMIPGISSASDLMLGLEHGYSAFKFFPAETSGGIAALQALAGPFTDITLCPTGGIGPHNLRQYLELPFVPCVGGSWLTPDTLQRRKAWDEITELARQALALVNQSNDQEAAHAK